MLQYVAVCCRSLCCSMLQCVAGLYVAVCCSMLQVSMLQYVAVCCNVKKECNYDNLVRRHYVAPLQEIVNGTDENSHKSAL